MANRGQNVLTWKPKWIYRTSKGKEHKLPRRPGSGQEFFQAAIQKVNALAGTPLQEINKKLSSFLEDAKGAFLAKSLSEDELVQVGKSICDIIDHLPRSFGKRFLFDAVLIRSLAKGWSDNLRVSGMLMPHYAENWGYLRLVMPSENTEHAHVVDLIHMPGQDQLEDIDLLGYPWVAHEWGHYAMLRHDSLFSPCFARDLNKLIASLNLASVADRGSAKAKAQRTIQESAKLWTPSPDQQNWAHELAIDLISLWICGPVYLHCMENHLTNDYPNPYLIDQGHPPYAVRAEALIKGAQQLGLGAYTTGLKGVVAGWDTSKWHLKEDNHFIALANPEIIEACTRAAFGFCKSLKLTVCSAQRVEGLRTRTTSPDAVDFGLDLLLIARTVFEEKHEQAYNDWERAVIERLASDLTQ